VKPESATKRLAVSLLSLSAAGLIGIVTRESYTAQAVIPTQGDRPTVGFGSTKQADGAPVKLGDTTDPVRALHTMQAHLSREEVQFRDSLPGVKLTQGEYDLYIDFVYQYGITNWRSSSMRRNLLIGDYRAACDALLQWKRAAGYDCSIPGNHRCPGVWTRKLERHAKCLAEQAP
jgi:GH24 family phage-related lysozyme (muramidase)